MDVFALRNRQCGMLLKTDPLDDVFAGILNIIPHSMDFTPFSVRMTFRTGNEPVATRLKHFSYFVFSFNFSFFPLLPLPVAIIPISIDLYGYMGWMAGNNRATSGNGQDSFSKGLSMGTVISSKPVGPSTGIRSHPRCLPYREKRRGPSKRRHCGRRPSRIS